MLRDVGLKVEITSSDFANWLKRAQSSPQEFGEVTFSRWSCGCQDADGILYPLYHSKSQWAKSNNPAMDAELDAGRVVLAHCWTADEEDWHYQVHDLLAAYGDSVRILTWDQIGRAHV